MNKIVTTNGVYDLSIPIDAKPNTDGEYYMVCPVCTPTRQAKHKSEKKLSVNIRMTPMKWHCNHCGEGGVILTEEYMNTLKIKPLLKKYDFADLSEDLLNWFWDKRRISEPTLQKMRISMSTEQVKQMKVPTGKEDLVDTYQTRKCLNFKYFKDGLLINIKFRDKYKNFKMISDASKIIYNIDSFKDKTKGIIVEGEIDVLSYIEAGLDTEYGIGSVPNGATISVKEKEHFEKTGELKVMSEAGLEYLDLAIEDLKHLEIIYLATDDDPAGIKLREELSRRLGKERCRYIKFSSFTNSRGLPVNDPNELLVEKGPAVLASTIELAIPYPVRGIHTSNEYWDGMLKAYDYGKPKGIPTGFPALDPFFNWMFGWLLIENGYPNNGKTSMALNLIAASIVLYKWRWGVYCPENYPEPNVIDMLAEIFVGKSLDPKAKNRMSKSEYSDVVNNFMSKYIYFLSDTPEGEDESYSPSDLRKIKKNLVRNFGIKGFLTDPWSSLNHDYTKFGGEDKYLEHELTKEVRLATTLNIINFISHHPRTTDNVDKAPSVFQLTGGKIWWIKAYSIFCVHRQNLQDWQNLLTEFHVQKQKDFKAAGELTSPAGCPKFRYDRLSRRLYCQNPDGKDPDKFDYFPFESYQETNQAIFEGF